MFVRKISPKLLQVSIRNNNEVPDQVQKNIEHLREWLKFQPHLRARNDDQFLLSSLRVCKFRMEKTKEMIDMMYSLQTAIPELYYNRDVTSSIIQDILSLGLILPIPKLASDDAPRVVVLKVAPIGCSISALVTVANMFLDLLYDEDDNIVISGVQVLYDCRGLTINHIISIIPFINTYRKYRRTVQRTLKYKQNGYYILYANSAYQTFFNMFTNLLEEKFMSKAPPQNGFKPIINRNFEIRAIEKFYSIFGRSLGAYIKIFNENNWDDLKKLVPTSVIPKEYGGDGDTIAELTSYWINRMGEKREWFLEQDKYGTDENLRREKISHFAESAGVDGFFKNLNID